MFMVMVACKHTQWSTVMWKNRMTLAEGGRLSSKTSCCSVGRKKTGSDPEMSNCCCDVFSYILPLLLFWPGRTFFFCADIIVLFLEGNIKSCLICVFFVFFTCLCGGSYAQTMRVMTWFSGRELSDTAECRFVRSWKLCVRFLWKGEKKIYQKGFFNGKVKRRCLLLRKCD